MPSRLINEPAVVAKPVSISPDKCWLSLAESDGPVAMLFLELDPQSTLIAELVAVGEYLIIHTRK